MYISYWLFRNLTHCLDKNSLEQVLKIYIMYKMKHNKPQKAERILFTKLTHYHVNKYIFSKKIMRHSKESVAHSHMYKKLTDTIPEEVQPFNR